MVGSMVDWIGTLIAQAAMAPEIQKKWRTIEKTSPHLAKRLIKGRTNTPPEINSFCFHLHVVRSVALCPHKNSIFVTSVLYGKICLTVFFGVHRSGSFFNHSRERLGFPRQLNSLATCKKKNVMLIKTDS